MKAFVLTSDGLDLVEAYVADQRIAGTSDAGWARRAGRAFCARVGGAREWEVLKVEEQLVLPRSERRVVTWLLASGRAKASPAYVVSARNFLGCQRSCGSPHRRP